MDIRLLVISIILILLGLVMIGVAFSLANQIILPTGSANWTAMEIAILIGGILFLIVGIGLFVYSFYASKQAYVPEVVGYEFSK